MNRTTPRLVAASLCTLLLLVGCQKKVTTENYEAITIGMSLDEVQRKLGRGEEQVISGVSIGSGGAMGGTGSNSQRTYIWHEDDGRQISVTVVDNKVITKGKSGF